MTHKYNDDRYVCYECIGDSYLKSEVRHARTSQPCMICNQTQPAIAFDILCDRVHEVVTNKFSPTAREPESWAMYKEGDIDWEREGDSVDFILDEILESERPLIEELKEELSSRHYSFDDVLAGMEDPYGDEACYELDKPNDLRFQDTWSVFESEIRTRTRFFGTKAEEALGEIFHDLGRYQTRSTPLIREAGPGTETRVVFRARRADGREAITRILKHPAIELGAPPSWSARGGRMNPQWISMFYGALDPETCVAEIAPPVGSAAVIGEFTIVRELRMLDLKALRELFVAEVSFFDPEFDRLRDKSMFLRRLVDIMSRPVLPTDEEYHYLPTQAVAEFICEKLNLNLDGLIYPSSQRGGISENVVLFRHASGGVTDDAEGHFDEVTFHRHDGEDFDIAIWKNKKRDARERSSERLDGAHRSPAGSLEDSNNWPDGAERKTEKPTLRLNLDSIEVRSIDRVNYETRKHYVSWIDTSIKEQTGDLGNG